MAEVSVRFEISEYASASESKSKAKICFVADINRQVELHGTPKAEIKENMILNFGRTSQLIPTPWYKEGGVMEHPLGFSLC